MSGRSALLACLGVFTAVVTGCGSGGGAAPASGSGAGTSACRLPGARVSEIVGFAVEDGVGTPGEQDCFYSTSDESRSVVVIVRHIPGGETKVLSNLKKEFSDVAPMSGSPGAYAIPHLSEVVLFDGGRQILVICRHLDAAKELALAKAVAG
jgi:hypothetical protein